MQLGPVLHHRLGDGLVGRARDALLLLHGLGRGRPCNTPAAGPASSPSGSPGPGSAPSYTPASCSGDTGSCRSRPGRRLGRRAPPRPGGPGTTAGAGTRNDYRARRHGLRLASAAFSCATAANGTTARSAPAKTSLRTLNMGTSPFPKWSPAVAAPLSSCRRETPDADVRRTRAIFPTWARRGSEAEWKRHRKEARGARVYASGNRCRA